MKYTTHIFCLSVLAAMMALQPLVAQNPPAAYVASSASALSASTSTDDPQDSVLTIRKRVDEVNVLFIATDRHGKFVRNLTQNDFSFLDDHKPVQSIVNFRRETDLPLKMGLLIDVSGSVHTRFEFEQDAEVWPHGLDAGSHFTRAKRSDRLHEVQPCGRGRLDLRQFVQWQPFDAATRTA